MVNYLFIENHFYCSNGQLDGVLCHIVNTLCVNGPYLNIRCLSQRFPIAYRFQNMYQCSTIVVIYNSRVVYYVAYPKYDSWVVNYGFRYLGDILKDNIIASTKINHNEQRLPKITKLSVFVILCLTLDLKSFHTSKSFFQHLTNVLLEKYLRII